MKGLFVLVARPLTCGLGIETSGSPSGMYIQDAAILQLSIESVSGAAKTVAGKSRADRTKTNDFMDTPS